MVRPKVEWDPSWDDDWQSLQGELKDEVEDEHPRDPEEAVNLYRFGFSIARKHPIHDWSYIEGEMYQDYMSGAPEPGEEKGEENEWEAARSWIRRGWEAARI